MRDLGRWIDSLTRKADGTALTYSHGALAVCKFLAERGALPCELAVLRMHLRDALPRAPAGRAPDVPDLRRLVGFYDAEMPAGEAGTLRERERLNGLRNAAAAYAVFHRRAHFRNSQRSIPATCATITAQLRRTMSLARATGGAPYLCVPIAARARTLPAGPAGELSHAEALIISHGPRGAGRRFNRVAAWAVVTHAAQTLADRIETEGRPSRRACCAKPRCARVFRHFVAMWLLNEGAQMSEVSVLLGHANTRITEQYYARHTDERLQEMHDQFAPEPEK
ncbi:MAG: tyrosine-type recombinase/integrase [Kouleothrix sp.]